MQKYRSSNHVPFAGLLMLVLATLAGGLLVGAVTAVIAHFLFLVVLFPMVMGVAGGAIIAAFVRGGKVRSPLVAGLFGILIALVIYGTYRYGEYIDAQRQAYESIKADAAGVTEAETTQAMDKFLYSKTGYSGFIGYVLYDAKQGVKITRTISSSSGTGLSFAGPFAWVYWAVELLLIAGFAAYIGSIPARIPFCESCDTWYGKDRRIGSADNQIARDLKAALKAGYFGQVRAALTPPSTAIPRLDLNYQRCEQCTTANPVLYLWQITTNSRRNTVVKDLIKGEVTPAQFTEITGQAL